MLDMETGYANVNGTRLYYEVAGSGHALALLHGSSSDTRAWDDQFELFARHYRVIRHDMRGHGKSALPTDKPYLHAEDLNALLEHLSVERAHVLGLSSGGGAVIDFALLYPQKTGALIPVSTGPAGFHGGSSTREIDQAIRDAFRDSGKRAATELAYEHPVFKSALQNPRSAASVKRCLDEANFWRMGRHDPIKRTEPPQIERLGEIGVPTMVIMGELDIPEMGPATDAIRDGVAGAKKVVMSGCGHMVNLEDPETFDRVVLDFLASV
jgi:pimeloyl-ACP methyl ester carboxylesterase